MAMVSRLKIERLKKGHTIYTMEKATGVPYHRYWMIECGLLPKPDQMKKICEVLEVGPQDVFPVYLPEMWQEYLTVN